MRSLFVTKSLIFSMIQVVIWKGDQLRGDRSKLSYKDPPLS